MFFCFFSSMSSFEWCTVGLFYTIMIRKCYANDMQTLPFQPAESEHRRARQRHGSFQLETVPRSWMEHMLDDSRKHHGWRNLFPTKYGVSWSNQLFVLPFLKLKWLKYLWIKIVNYQGFVNFSSWLAEGWSLGMLRQETHGIAGRTTAHGGRWKWSRQQQSLDKRYCWWFRNLKQPGMVLKPW